METASSNTNHTSQHHPAPAPRTKNTANSLATSLLKECGDLLHELTAFQLYQVSIGKPNIFEVRQFKTIVVSELKAVKTLADRAAAASTVNENARNEDAGVKDRRSAGNDSDGEEEEDDDDDDESEFNMDPAERKVLHSLRSSNSPFYTTVWNTAKTSCTGLVALSKRFYYFDLEKGRTSKGTGDELGDIKSFDEEAFATKFEKLETNAGNTDSMEAQKKNILVDIVADSGEEWVKVSTVTPNRLLFELAKQGWENAWDSASENGEDDSSKTVTPKVEGYSSEDEEDMLELVKLAVEMKKAAASVRIRYKHPRIRFVLPKIVEGQISEIDWIIGQIRKTGATVDCGPPESSTAHGCKENNVSGELQSMFQSLLPNPYPYITQTLNVDCTLLLALVSDLSYIRSIPHSPNYHPAINRQIELEAQRPLVPSELWPAMGDRALVCTKEAAQRMHEIVDTIGTETEKSRTKLLMGEIEGKNREELISGFQELTNHEVPLDWNIPIRVVDAQAEIECGWKEGRLPGLAHNVADKLSDINRSVFLYGWSSGFMTISSNRAVLKQVEALVEKHRNGDDDVCGPNVWVCDTARSLIGKESSRRK